MSETTQDDTEALEARLSVAEAQLRRTKTILWVIGAIILCALIPPIGAVVGLVTLILLIVVPVLAYMYGVTWVLDRYFGINPKSNQVQQ